MPKIENWSVVYNPNASPYTAPELLTPHLYGNIYNHPKIKDGTFVTTSAIQCKQNDCIMTISGSIYELGTPDSNYIKQFPDAKNRLLNSLKPKI